MTGAPVEWVAAVVAVAAGFPPAIDAALLGVSTLLYLYGVWSRRATLGLGAFRSALRRRPAPQVDRLAAEV